MNPSSFVNPSNPLRSGSRAVLSIHARNDYFPGGDRDKIRFLDNVNSTLPLMDTGVPRIHSTGNPIYLRDDIVKRIIVEAYIKGDRDVESDRMARLVSKSNRCKSVKGTLNDEVVKLIPIFIDPCDDVYLICDAKTKESMDFGSKSIKMIPSCIEKHAGVKMLNLSNNQIEKMEGFDTLSSLKELNLTSNRIGKIEGLDTLTNLELLDLGDNQIKKLDDIGNLVNLKELDLSFNHIEKLEGLDALVNLKYFSVYDNAGLDLNECYAFEKKHPDIEMWCYS